MSELRSRPETRFPHRRAVEGDSLMERSLVPALGRTSTGRALSFALLGLGAHAATPVASQAESRRTRNHVDVSVSTRCSSESHDLERQGPEIEAIASAWEISNERYRDWLRASFPAELSDPVVLGAIRLESNQNEDYAHEKHLLPDRVLGLSVSAVLHTESGVPVLSLLPGAFDDVGSAHPISHDRRFDDLIQSKYHALVRLLVGRISHPAKEAATRLLQDMPMHGRRASIDVHEWFATIGEEVCRQSPLETDLAFKTAIVDRVLTRTRVEGARAHQAVTKSVELFFACIEDAYPDFSFHRTASVRQAGIVEMRHGYRTAAVKRTLHALEACDDLEEATIHSFDRPVSEWSLVERASLVPESQIPPEDLPLVRQVLLPPHEQAIAIREASEAIQRQAHHAHATGQSSVYAVLMDKMTHSHDRKRSSVDHVVVAWDRLRFELRSLRRGLKDRDSAQSMTRDDFFLHEQALMVAIKGFVRLWTRASVQDRERLRPTLHALDRLYEGDDKTLTPDQRTCFERILAVTSV